MIYYAVLAAVCGLSFILKTPYFNLPLDRDYGGHGYVAYCWLKGKGMPYRDVLESKTPGLKIVYMMIIQWFGMNRKAFHLFFALYNILTTIAVYAVGAILFTPTAGLVAAALYALYSSVPSLWWHFSNIECYYVLPMVMSFFFLACGGFGGSTASTLTYVACAGLFGGITFMFKQPSLINTVGPALIFLILYSPVSIILALLAYGAAFLIPVLAFIVYFVIIHKTPWTKTPFGAVILGITKRYLTNPLFKANRATIESNRRRFRTILYDLSMIGLWGCAGAIAILTKGNTTATMLVLWAACAVLAGIMSRTYLAYHFIPTVPPLCILSGMAIAATASSLFSRRHFSISPAEAAAIAALVVPLCFFLYQLIKDLLLPRELMGIFYSGEDQLYALTEEVGKYIKANTNENDYVYEWGQEPGIYFWSERRAPTWSIYPPIGNPAVFTKEHVDTEFGQLLAHLPKYFVLNSPFGDYKQFEQVIIHNYILEKRFDPYFYLFKLKQQSQP